MHIIYTYIFIVCFISWLAEMPQK